MRKEVVLAITIGLGLGLIIAYGVYTANQATKNIVPSPAARPTISVNPTPTSNNDLLTLFSPQDGDIFSEPAATVSGQIKPGSQLIILAENEDIVVTPETDGRFNQTIKLINGANLVQLTVIKEDQKQEVYLNLVYTTTKYE